MKKNEKNMINEKKKNTILVERQQSRRGSREVLEEMVCTQSQEIPFHQHSKGSCWA